MYIYNNKWLLATIALLSMAWSQNDGLVIVKYDNGGVKTEGNYVSGVRNGDWAEYWEEVWWLDYGEDGEANTKGIRGVVNPYLLFFHLYKKYVYI